MACETLEETERVAYICAAYQQPCGLACDAYHRLLLDANTDQAAQGRGLLVLASEPHTAERLCQRYGRLSGGRCSA